MESKIEKMFLDRNNAFAKELQGLWSQSKRKEGTVATMLYRYYFTFHSHFLVWLIQLEQQVSLKTTARVLRDNIECEIKDEHQQHLFNMLYGMQVFHDVKRGCALECDLAVRSQEVPLMFLRSNPLALLAFVASLEYLSLTFVPFLNQCTRGKIRVVQQYALLHGEADKKHADELLAALVSEAELQMKNFEYGVAAAGVSLGIQTAHSVLRAIFQPIAITHEP